MGRIFVKICCGKRSLESLRLEIEMPCHLYDGSLSALRITPSMAKDGSLASRRGGSNTPTLRRVMWGTELFSEVSNPSRLYKSKEVRSQTNGSTFHFRCTRSVQGDLKPNGKSTTQALHCPQNSLVPRLRGSTNTMQRQIATSHNKLSRIMRHRYILPRRGFIDASCKAHGHTPAVYKCSITHANIETLELPITW